MALTCRDCSVPLRDQYRAKRCSRCSAKFREMMAWLLRDPSHDEQLFWGKVRVTSGCWEWQGAKTSRGYGSIRLGRRTLVAHRYSYQFCRGQIPVGLELDHLCRNHECVSPYHLEAVTHAENIRRGRAGHAATLRAAQITQCPQGHPYDPANTLITKEGKRHCRACHRIRERTRRNAGKHVSSRGKQW